MRNKEIAMDNKQLQATYLLNDKTCARIKCGIQIIICVLVLAMLLLSKILTYSYGAVNIKLSGINTFTAIFFGGNLKYNLYGDVVNIIIPSYISLFLTFAIIMVVAIGIGYIIVALSIEKDIKWLGYLQLAIGVALVLMYILLLTVKSFKTTSYDSTELIFYQIFEVSIIMPAAGILIIMSGLLQLKFKLVSIPILLKYWFFYAVLIIPTVLILVFNIYPIILQIILSFKNYTLAQGIWGSNWIGFTNFVDLFTTPAMLLVIFRTIYLSILRIVAGIIPSVLFALLLFHITNKRLRSAIQTIVYIPHFFSWVVIYAIISAFMTPDGVINILRQRFGFEGIDFLSNPSLFYPNMIISSIWKEVGWGTILYMASLMAINKELFDAAAIDGAGVFQKLKNITLPGIVPILTFQTIMAVGGVLRGAGGEQILIFATSAVRENKALVIDTWLYWQGLGELKYGLSSAMSFAQSIVGFGLVIGTHKMSQKLVGIGAW